MNTYSITMKNGKEHTVRVEESQSPIGLWVWSMREHYPRVLNFGNISVLSTEIQSIEMTDGVSNYQSKANNNSQAPVETNYAYPPPPPPFRFPDQ